MGHTQGIILDKHKNVALENLAVRYVQRPLMLWFNTQITCYLNNYEIMYLEFWNRMIPLWIITLWSSRFGSEGSTFLHATLEAQSCVGLCKKNNDLITSALPIGSLDTFLHYCLFYVNQGIRPYADISGVSVCVYVCVCTVYADVNVLHRSQTVIEPCTENESFFYMYSWVFVCLRERKIYVHMTHEQVYVQ